MAWTCTMWAVRKGPDANLGGILPPGGALCVQFITRSTERHTVWVFFVSTRCTYITYLPPSSRPQDHACNIRHCHSRHHYNQNSGRLGERECAMSFGTVGMKIDVDDPDGESDVRYLFRPPMTLTPLPDNIEFPLLPNSVSRPTTGDWASYHSSLQGVIPHPNRFRTAGNSGPTPWPTGQVPRHVCACN